MKNRIAAIGSVLAVLVVLIGYILLLKPDNKATLYGEDAFRKANPNIEITTEVVHD